jgi:hypothetical protein
MLDKTLYVVENSEKLDSSVGIAMGYRVDGPGSLQWEASN